MDVCIQTDLSRKSIRMGSHRGKKAFCRRRPKLWEVSKLVFAMLFACLFVASMMFVILYSRCYFTLVNIDEKPKIHQNRNYIDHAIELDSQKHFKLPPSTSPTICSWIRVEKPSQGSVVKFSSHLQNFQISVQNYTLLVNYNDNRVYTIDNEFIAQQNRSLDNKWNHFCFLLSSNSVKIFVNGQQFAEKTISWRNKNKHNGVLLLGDQHNKNHVLLHELHVYKRALTKGELFWQARMRPHKNVTLLTWETVLEKSDYSILHMKYD